MGEERPQPKRLGRWSLLLERYPGRAIQGHPETMGSPG
jgi:hypothetical protein